MKFFYRVKDSSGKTVTGKAESSSPTELNLLLKKQGYTILEIAEKPSTVNEKKSPARKTITFRVGISDKELLLFTRQMSSTLKAGIPLLRCLLMQKEQTRNGSLKKILESVITEIQQGKSFSEALKSHNPPFDYYYYGIIKVGETTGNLPEVFERLADSIEKEYKIKNRIKSSVSYPIFILLFSLTIVYFMMTKLLPTFVPIFKDSGLDIENDYPVTAFLVRASNFASQPTFLPILILAILLIYFLFEALRRFEKSRTIIDSAIFYFPFIGSFIQLQYFTRFTESMGTLVASGVHILQGLQILKDTSTNLIVRNALKNAVDMLNKGTGFSTAMEKVHVFPQTMIQMVAVGEEAGNIDEMLFRVSAYYEREFDDSVSSIMSLLEPVMMVLVGIMVFIFVLGVLLPIVGITQGYQNQI